MPVVAPSKPFPGYKWRWASVAPSEGLNDQPVYLGVLRVLAKHEGKSFGDAGVLAGLAEVMAATGTRLNLVRTGDRNLIRNSGQYWSAFGLLAAVHSGVIELTDLGRRVAGGDVTPSEFAAATVRSHRLPNSTIEPTAPWGTLRIRPLALILQVMAGLAGTGTGEAYLTKSELVKIVIPLAGASRPVADHVEAIRSHRAGIQSLVGWPDCAPRANDPRFAAEFLRFLAEYGYLVKDEGHPEPRYVLRLTPDEVGDLLAGTSSPDLSTALTAVRAVGVADLVERAKRLVEVTARPGQRSFRKKVMAAYGSTCFLTGTSFVEVLQAAHIRPVKSRGSDQANNGVCLRTDIHDLFDAGHIRIDPDGNVHLSEALAASGAYALPARVTWPAVVHPDNLDFRWKYL